MPSKIAVIGAGSWGTATANVFADAGGDVTIWGRDPKIVEGIQRSHENPRYLKGFPLSERLKASSNLKELVSSADWIVCAIPTQQIRNVFSPLAKELGSKLVVNTSKGIEMRTHMRVGEIFKDIAPSAQYYILSGPSFAEEVVRKLPTAVTIAGPDDTRLGELQKLLSTPYFRSYRSNDIVGVELTGALKNVIAIASGMVAGLELGYNAQAAIINRGIAEVARLGKKLGADPLSFLGLSGLGDLVLTCTGPLSRNRSLGVLLAQGKDLKEASGQLGGVAEGVFTAESAYSLAKSLKVEMPITEQIYKILYEGNTPQRALQELMNRDLKQEWE